MFPKNSEEFRIGRLVALPEGGNSVVDEAALWDNFGGPTMSCTTDCGRETRPQSGTIPPR